MEAEFVQWLVGQAGVAGLAGLALWMLRRSYEERLQDRDRYREEVSRLHNDVRSALDQNTLAYQGLRETLIEMMVGSRNE